MFKSIGNDGPLFQGLNQNYVNASNSHYSGNFSNTIAPTSNHTLPEPVTNAQAAAAYIPGCQKGGKISRRRINKISMKYKMAKSRRSYLKSRVRRMRNRRRTYRRNRSQRRSRYQRGGWAQYQNNMPVSNSYSLGGPLSPSNVGLANPPPINSISNNAIDNLNHNALNSYGNSGAGMGTASKGWY